MDEIMGLLECASKQYGTHERIYEVQFAVTECMERGIEGSCAAIKVYDLNNKFIGVVPSR